MHAAWARCRMAKCCTLRCQCVGPTAFLSVAGSGAVCLRAVCLKAVCLRAVRLRAVRLRAVWVGTVYPVMDIAPKLQQLVVDVSSTSGSLPGANQTHAPGAALCVPSRCGATTPAGVRQSVLVRKGYLVCSCVA
eukprot:361197-Chlamydomonas_euryale.AAC.1